MTLSLEMQHLTGSYFAQLVKPVAIRRYPRVITKLYS